MHYEKNFDQTRSAEPLTFNINLFVHLVSTSASTESQPTQPEPSPQMASDFFCRITQHTIDTGHAQEVENELRSACVSAPKLVKAIRRNEALGYLDTQNLSSVELYDLLNEHFGLSFKVRTFQTSRSK